MAGVSNKIRLYFDEAAPEEFEASDQALYRIRAFTDQFHAPRPIIFTIECGDHGIMYVGVGAENGVFLSHTPADGDPPYSSSFNDGAASSAGVIEYYLLGAHHTEIEAKHVIPVQTALSGIEHFLQTGSLSNKVNWVEV